MASINALTTTIILFMYTKYILIIINNLLIIEVCPVLELGIMRRGTQINDLRAAF